MEKVLDPETGEINEVSLDESEETDGIFSDAPKSSDYPVLREMFEGEGLGSGKEKRDRDGSGSDDEMLSKQLKLSDHDLDSTQQAGEGLGDSSQGSGGKALGSEGRGPENSHDLNGAEDDHAGELAVGTGGGGGATQ